MGRDPDWSASTESAFRTEVADRFGLVPNFFCSAQAAPELIAELWGFARSGYLDSPLPSVFKERLFVHCPASVKLGTASSGMSDFWRVSAIPQVTHRRR